MPDFKSTELGGITNLALLATIKEGFVDGVDGFTHLKRLDAVLKTLSAIALGARESQAQSPDPDDDFVGRMRIVHFFRFAIVPPEPNLPGGRHRFMLNVTFDGGWEPYMRVIWRDLGTTLDFMFCHCEEYPLSHVCSFEQYIAWVRKHEVQGGFFYTDGPQSIADRRFLTALNTDQVQKGFPVVCAGPAPAPAAIAAAAGAAAQALAQAALKPMAALYALAPLFPDQPAGDDGILLRVAHAILRKVHAANATQLFLSPEDRQRHAAMLRWFERPLETRPAAGPSGVDETQVQGGILKRYENIEWGCLILLRVAGTSPSAIKAAQQALAKFQVTCAADPHDKAGACYRNVALTYQGLRALAVADRRLALLPQEFVEGMAARAGVLGDVRCNHPDRWSRPERHWSGLSPSMEPLPPVDLETVHLVVQLRCDKKPANVDAAWKAELQALRANDAFEVLSVQEMVRRPEPHSTDSREHFGFIDGASQPHIGPKTPNAIWDDEVPAGEILLGHPNRRGDARVPTQPDALFDNGSFLVLRKMRQNVELLRTVTGKLARDAQLPAEELLGLMMGRTKDGELLDRTTARKTNDFDFSADPTGAKCPIQSHMRRANPRTAALPMPRIVRRGMSYGPASDDTSTSAPRGLFFMAYNASIAEQFEQIQHWLAGSTPSGGFSGHSDPFLGVPDPGKPRPFGFQRGGGQVYVDLGPEPFASLEWGLYLFVPSIDGLKELARPAPKDVPPVVAPVPPTTEFLQWQRRLEDGSTRDAAWQEVREKHGGALRTDYGVLVGAPEFVKRVFSEQQNYSVRRYAERMDKSIGIGYLGQDPDTDHDRFALASNAALADVTEEDAFIAAHRAAHDFIEHERTFANAAAPFAVDVAALGEAVLASLCTKWFGFPDGKRMVASPALDEPRPQCPAYFFATSKQVFGVHPSVKAMTQGELTGQALRKAVADGIADRLQAGTAQAPVAAQIQAAVLAAGGKDDEVARTVAGAMLGFPPTTWGMLRSVAGQWLPKGMLSTLQNDLVSWRARHDSREPFDAAEQVIRPGLIATMLKAPVPEMLYRVARTAHSLGKVHVEPGDLIVIGIVSASQQVADPTSDAHYVMFGGKYHGGPGANDPLHACPGYAMAMGTLLGIFFALLDAGPLRAAGGTGVRIG